MRGMTDYQRWIHRVIKELEKLGWTVRKNGHIKFKSPDGKTIVCSYSPRSSFAIHDVRRDFKRVGVELST